MQLAAMCALSTEKEAKKTRECLAKADVPALQDLALKTASPGDGYCTEKGVQEHVRCMPKCACKGGAQYKEHAEGFAVLGNTLFPGRAPCFDATATYDSMCGDHREASGLAPGGIAAIVVVVVLFVGGGVAGVVYIMQLRARAAEEAAALPVQTSENEFLVEGAKAYMPHPRYHESQYHAHPAHHAHHEHHTHPAHYDPARAIPPHSLA